MDAKSEKDVQKYIQKALSGEADAFEWIVRKYQKRIYFTVLSMVMNHEDANDVLQDTFIKAYTKLDTYDPRYPFYPWLYRIAINTTLNHQKRKKRNKALSLDDTDGNHSIDLSTEPEQMSEIEEGQLMVELKQALQEIPVEQRMVFLLRVRDELSYKEISEQLDISLGTVMSRLSRAREKLRSHLVHFLQTRDVEV